MKLSVIMLMKKKLSARSFVQVKAAQKHVDEIDSCS